MSTHPLAPRATPLPQASNGGMDGRYAWIRLLASLAIGAIGGAGMWAVAVILPELERDFGVARGTASLAYTFGMLGLAIGGIFLGRLTDKKGILWPIAIGTVALGLGFYLASLTTNFTLFLVIQAVLIGGLGGAAVFGPLVADISFWFEKRRGIAVAIAASGNYVAGTVWPPIMQGLVERFGWRTTYQIVGLVCVLTIPLLMLVLRRPTPREVSTSGPVLAGDVDRNRPLGLAPQTLVALLVVAGIACCVGMSMPQVHIVAYCNDLNYGSAVGAWMLSLMFGFGVVSRLISGYISDRIGGIPALLLGSTLQCLTLLLFLPISSLGGLYIVSALFGLAQGGIVPSYAIILREHLKAEGIAFRISLVLMSTVGGMALGGWLSGLIFDVSGSYRAAFIHGIGWNLLNITIALWLFHRKFGQRLRRRSVPATA